MRRPSFAPWMGLFETVWVEGGKPLFLTEHWKSLCWSAHVLDLNPAIDFRAKLPDFNGKTGRWRWIVSPDSCRDSFELEDEVVPEVMSLALSPVRVGSQNWDARHKTLSYLSHWQARESVRADDALMLNEQGEIATAAMSNIFWVSDNEILTSSLECGCRAGVVRSWVMRQTSARQVRDTHEALDDANEIFLTNSRIGVCPVIRWGQRQLELGPVAQGLRELYRQEVQRQQMQ